VGDGRGGHRELDVAVLFELLGQLVVRGQVEAAEERVRRVGAWIERKYMNYFKSSNTNSWFFVRSHKEKLFRCACNHTLLEVHWKFGTRPSTLHSFVVPLRSQYTGPYTITSILFHGGCLHFAFNRERSAFAMRPSDNNYIACTTVWTWSSRNEIGMDHLYFSLTVEAKILWGSFKDPLRILRGSFKDSLRILQGFFEDPSRILWGSFKDPLRIHPIADSASERIVHRGSFPYTILFQKGFSFMAMFNLSFNPLQTQQINKNQTKENKNEQGSFRDPFQKGFCSRKDCSLRSFL
jgi:hypothetical protein